MFLLQTLSIYGTNAPYFCDSIVDENVGLGNANFAMNLSVGNKKKKTGTKTFSPRELETQTIQVTISHCKNLACIHLFFHFT